MSDEITTPEALDALALMLARFAHGTRWDKLDLARRVEAVERVRGGLAGIAYRPDRPSDLAAEVVVKGRCPEHHLTYCEPCGWITVAEVERLREAAAVAEQYAGIAHEQRDEARAELAALRAFREDFAAMASRLWFLDPDYMGTTSVAMISRFDAVVPALGITVTDPPEPTVAELQAEAQRLCDADRRYEDGETR